MGRVIASSQQEPGEAQIERGPHAQSLVLSLCTMAGIGVGPGLPLVGTEHKWIFLCGSKLEKELSLQVFLEMVINF